MLRSSITSLYKRSSISFTSSSSTSSSILRSTLRNNKIVCSTTSNNNNSNNSHNKNSNSNNNNNNEDFNKYKKEINGKRTLVLFSFSLGGLFGFGNRDENDTMVAEKKRVAKQQVTTFEEAMEWYQTFYQHQDIEYFIDAMILLLGKESQKYLKTQLAYIKQNKDLQTLARIQTIQSFYYLPMVGFISEMMRRHPELANEWYTKFMATEEITTPWKSVLGNLDPSMLINLAVSLVDTPQCTQLQRQIAITNLTPRNKETGELKKGVKIEEPAVQDAVKHLRMWATKQKESLPTYPLLMIGEYLCTGDTEIVKKIALMWRRSLAQLEKSALSNTISANTTNDINKKLEFDQRDQIIDELSQAIRLLSKDKQAYDILKSELSHHVQRKESNNIRAITDQSSDDPQPSPPPPPAVINNRK